MATNTDALRTLIGTIVMSDAAQKVDFYLDKMHVDGSGLSYVALALASKPRGGRGLSIAVAAYVRTRKLATILQPIRSNSRR
jgi:hypothetical protein